MATDQRQQAEQIFKQRFGRSPTVGDIDVFTEISEQVAQRTDVPDVQDVSGLEATRPISLPTQTQEAPAPDIAGLDTSALRRQARAIQEQFQRREPSPAELQQTTLRQQLMQTLRGLGTERQRLEQVRVAEGVPEIEQRLVDVSSQIQALQKEATARQIEITGQEAGVPKTIVSAQAARADRDRAVQALRLSAVAQTIQGNLALAQQRVQQSLEAEFEPRKQRLQLLQTALEFNKQDLSREERRRAEELQIDLEERRRLIEGQEQERQNILNFALKAAERGADSLTVNRITQSEKIEDALDLAAPFFAPADEPVQPIVLKPGEILIDPSTGSLVAEGLPKDGIGTNVMSQSERINSATKLIESGLAGSLNEAFSLIDGSMGANPVYISNGKSQNRADRNNNPLNIKASDFTLGFSGVSGVEQKPAEDGGNFLQFQSASSGFDAAKRLWTEGRAYKGVSVDTALKRWSGNGYGGALANSVGIDPKRAAQDLSSAELNRLMEAMARREGFTGSFNTAVPTAQNLRYKNDVRFSYGEKIDPAQLPLMGGKRVSDTQAQKFNVPAGVTDKQLNWIIEHRPGNSTFQSLGQAEATKLQELVSLQERAGKIRDAKEFVRTGKIQTSLQKLRPSAKQRQQFFRLEKLTGLTLAEFIKDISGAAVSEQEARRLASIVPNVGMGDTEFGIALEKFENETNRTLAKKAEQFGFDDINDLKFALSGDIINELMNEGTTRQAIVTQDVFDYINSSAVSGIIGTSF